MAVAGRGSDRRRRGGPRRARDRPRRRAGSAGGARPGRLDDDRERRSRTRASSRPFAATSTARDLRRSAGDRVLVGALPGLLTAISYDGTTLAYAQTQGGERRSRSPRSCRRWRRAGRRCRARWPGRTGAFLVAARPIPLGPGQRPGVFLLARRLDDEHRRGGGAARLGSALLVSDGRRSLAQRWRRGGPLLGAARAARASRRGPIGPSQAAGRGNRHRARALGLGARSRGRVRTGGDRRRSHAAATVLWAWRCRWPRARSPGSRCCAGAGATGPTAPGEPIGAARQRDRSGARPRSRTGPPPIAWLGAGCRLGPGDGARPLRAGRPHRRGRDGGGVHRDLVRLRGIPALVRGQAPAQRAERQTPAPCASSSTRPTWPRRWCTRTSSRCSTSARQRGLLPGSGVRGRARSRPAHPPPQRARRAEAVGDGDPALPRQRGAGAG